MSLFHGIKWIDTLGAVNAFKNVDGKPRVSTSPYLYDIAEGNVTGHSPWSKIGFNPDVGTGEEDIWSNGGAYTFPTAAAQWELYSADNDDRGLVLFGNAEGANQTTLCDVCTATTFVDASENFSTVEVGDCILISPKGTTPQWGYVNDITSKATGTLGVTSWSGAAAGTAVPSGEAYTIVDQNGDTGAQVVKIDYLTGTYAAKTCLCCLNGTTEVAIDGSDGAAATDKFRVNSFRVIAAGSSGYAEGAVSLRAIGDTPVYSYITATKTRARNIIYTVPLGKTLYINMWTVSWGYQSATSKNEYCRFYTRANVEPSTKMNTGAIFYPFTEVNLSGGTTSIEFPIPTVLSAKTDIRVTSAASAAGGATSTVLRGWTE